MSKPSGLSLTRPTGRFFPQAAAPSNTVLNEAAGELVASFSGLSHVSVSFSGSSFLPVSRVTPSTGLSRPIHKTLKASSRASTLDTAQISDTIERLPTDRLDALTHLTVGSLLPDVDRFLRFITRCPNVISLTCGRVSEDIPTTNLGPEVLPSLKHFKGRLGIAKLLITGRPLESLKISSPFGRHSPQTVVEVLPLLSTGTAVMKSLHLSMFRWSEGCIEELSGVFPRLETLKLDVYPEKDPNLWLPAGLIESVRRFEDLTTISVTCGPPPRIPNQGQLNSQCKVLHAARKLRPKLCSVTFQKGVLWTADSLGRWEAVSYSCTREKQILFSALEFIGEEENESQGEETDCIPMFPPELLIQIVSEVGLSRGDADAFDEYASDSEHVQETLKSLCLVDRRLRVLAQPLLFDHVAIIGSVGPCLSRIRGLLRLLSDREESATWVKALKFKWVAVSRPRSPKDKKFWDALLADSTKLFTSLRLLQRFEADGIRLSDEMVAHLYHLPALRSLRLRSIIMPADPIVLLGLDPDSLVLEDVHIDRLFHGAPPPPPALLRLTQSPSLCKLGTGWVFLNDAILTLAGYTFRNVTELSVDEGSSSVHSVVSLAALCPNLVSITLGKCIAPYHTRTTDPIPPLLSAEACHT